MVDRVFRGITYTVETATANDQALNGTPNPDWIEALGGNNQVSTGAGNDVVLAGVRFGSIANYDPYGGEAIFYGRLPDAGNNTIFTGAGDDYVAVTSGNDLVRLGEGNDIFDGGGGGNDTVYGGAGNDIIDLGLNSPGEKIIRAGAGDDTLYGGSTGDILDGGAGEDFLSLRLSDQTAGIFFDGTASTHLTLADGTTARNWEVFNIFGGSGNDTLIGGAGNDFLSSFSGIDIITGGAGNDSLSGGAGDTLDGGAGEDFLSLSLFDQTVGIIFDGTASTDITLADGTTLRNGEAFGVSGGSGNDTLIGGAGDDTFFGNDGSDRLRGGAGDDSLDGGTGDTLDGGAGEDFLSLSLFDQTVGIIFDGTTSTHLTLADGTTARNGETFSVSGGSGNDSLTGGVGDDSFSGNDGDDSLRGGAGNDFLDGGAGIDSIRGGVGDDFLGGGTGDTLDGGAGEDSLSLDLSDQTAGIVFDGTTSTDITLADGTTLRNGETFSVSGGSGNDTLTGGVGDDGLSGNDGDDSLFGGAGDDFLGGGLGNDSLFGGAGDDFFFAGDGDDSLRGGTGDDTLVGETGNDSLRGGVGDDFLSGNDGDDSLIGGVGNDLLNGVAGIDTLIGASFIDFGVGSIDTLTGGSESDLFVLGAVGGVFYDSDQVNSPASTDYAQITDFDFSQDQIQLTGAAINYSLVEGIVPDIGLSGTSIYLAGQTNELIGVVTNVTGLDLNASYFSYV